MFYTFGLHPLIRHSVTPSPEGRRSDIMPARKRYSIHMHNSSYAHLSSNDFRGRHDKAVTMPSVQKVNTVIKIRGKADPYDIRREKICAVAVYFGVKEDVCKYNHP